VPEIPWVALADGSPWALLALAVFSVIRGWLVPSATVTLLMQRAEDYKTAWEQTEQARAVQAQQLAQLVEYARTADVVLRSLPSPPSHQAAS